MLPAPVAALVPAGPTDTAGYVKDGGLADVTAEFGVRSPDRAVR
jgi:hypothetical protein